LEPTGAFLGQAFVFHGERAKSVGDKRFFGLGRPLAHFGGP
jgi:hypothetical protein